MCRLRKKNKGRVLIAQMMCGCFCKRALTHVSWEHLDKQLCKFNSANAFLFSKLFLSLFKAICLYSDFLIMVLFQFFYLHKGDAMRKVLLPEYNDH